MPNVLSQDIRSTIIKSGGYSRPGAASVLGAGGHMVHAHDNNSPTLIDRNGAIMAGGGAGGVGAHYRLPVGIKFSIVLDHDNVTGGKVVLFRPRGTGGEQAIYLPYCDNYITSCVLPTQGVDYFFTDNLSGCAVFIDQVHGSRDLVAYHANARATQGAHGDGPATTLMDNMVTAARAEYTGWLHSPLNAGREIKKARYFGQAVADYQARKTGQGRTNILTMGEGTNVVGFHHDNRWEFWYQTWALASYDRPDNSWGKLTKGDSQAAVYGQGKILKAERFWRQP